MKLIKTFIITCIVVLWTIALTSCQTTPIAHDAPVRLFHPEIATPNGRPHPGWSPALLERMAREDRNPVLTPMDHDPLRQPLDYHKIERWEIDYKARQLNR
jgi:hypothetical protein